jgi:protein ImuA
MANNVLSLADFKAPTPIWRGPKHLAGELHTISSGHHALDAVLPGGGWPLRTLCECLLAQPGQGEWQLLHPVLRHFSEQAQSILLVAPPQLPYAPALLQVGIDPQQVLVVRPEQPKDVLWSAEQALKSGAMGVVIIWIKETDSASMRRIQLATAEHSGLSMVVRDMAFARAPSPANLRLILRAHAGNYDVEVFKARGLLCSMAVQLVWG